MSPEDAARFWSRVDKAGDCWEWTAGRYKHGYGQFRLDGSPRGAHRLSYEMAHGKIPEGMVIDHMCHNPPCVNPAHLRVATYKQNMENRSGPQKNNKSGVRGVYWDKRLKKWRAEVKHNRKKYKLGWFDSLEEAGAVALAKRRELFDITT